ncbi:MAG: hypothetical protein KGZ40_06980 [Clostridiales bacterium]|nr:hypothetical protein [Clostridiales bacterium]
MSARRAVRLHVVTAPDPRGPEGLDALRRGITEALDVGAGDIRVDLRDAHVIDGACLAVILRAASSMPTGRSLTVAASADIARSFAEWRLDTVFDVVDVATDQVASSTGRE